MSAIAEVPARVLAAQLGLPQAWERASSKSGMAGADGVRLARFAKNAAANLRVLEARLARETYRPHPLRAARGPIGAACSHPPNAVDAYGCAKGSVPATPSTAWNSPVRR